MQKYIATIMHHKIASARCIEGNCTLDEMKVAANKEFGDEFNDITIVIYDTNGETVATRQIDSNTWNDYSY